MVQLAGRRFNMGDDVCAFCPGKARALDTRRGGEGGGMGFLAGAAMTVPGRAGDRGASGDGARETNFFDQAHASSVNRALC